MVSRPLDSLFRVLFNFPSRYLLSIGLVVIFSLRWSLPPALGCSTKQPDSPVRSLRTSRLNPFYRRRHTGLSPCHGLLLSNDLGGGRHARYGSTCTQHPSTAAIDCEVMRWAGPVSVALTTGIPVGFFYLRLLICLNLAGSLPADEVHGRGRTPVRRAKHSKPKTEPAQRDSYLLCNGAAVQGSSQATLGPRESKQCTVTCLSCNRSPSMAWRAARPLPSSWKQAARARPTGTDPESALTELRRAPRSYTFRSAASRRPKTTENLALSAGQGPKAALKRHDRVGKGADHLTRSHRCRPFSAVSLGLGCVLS